LQERLRHDALSSIPTTLSIGETRTSIEIRAREKWNSTGILVAPGERYSLAAHGEWIDGGIKAGPAGFPTSHAPAISRWLLKTFESSRRAPAENWFCLIGCVGHDEETAFRIGEKCDEWIVSAAGELTCFANDVPFAYFNNSGAVRLAVTRRA
jgi:hypothetical protein